MTIHPDRREIARYLGYHGIKPDAAIEEEIETCVAQLQQVVTPRFVYEKFDCSVECAGEFDCSMECAGKSRAATDATVCEAPPEAESEAKAEAVCEAPPEAESEAKAEAVCEAPPEAESEAKTEAVCETPPEAESEAATIRLGGLTIKSNDLAGNLQGCCAAYLMAVTLGPGPDVLIRRASVGRMSRAVVLQAAAAAMVEDWCDQINHRILEEAGREGLCGLRPRFSPGYGDLPLALQKDISSILNMPKEIGVSLTDTLLMTPSKSVTAIIGVAERQAVNAEQAPGIEQKSEFAEPASGLRHPSEKGGCASCNLADTCAYRER